MPPVIIVQIQQWGDTQNPEGIVSLAIKDSTGSESRQVFRRDFTVYLSRKPTFEDPSAPLPYEIAREAVVRGVPLRSNVLEIVTRAIRAVTV